LHKLQRSRVLRLHIRNTSSYKCSQHNEHFTSRFSAHTVESTVIRNENGNSESLATVQLWLAVAKKDHCFRANLCCNMKPQEARRHSQEIKVNMLLWLLLIQMLSTAAPKLCFHVTMSPLLLLLLLLDQTSLRSLCAASLPDKMAPCIVALYLALVCSPANCTRPHVPSSGLASTAKHLREPPTLLKL
jgi:hypothetical protein